VAALTILHDDAYYSRVHEPSQAAGDPLTAAAHDLVRVFHGSRRPMDQPGLTRDLTLGQMRLLLLLRREGPQPMGRIAELFDLSTTASSGFVARVERHGLVVRRHRSVDRRVVECALSDAGRELVEGWSGVRLEVIREGLSRLEPRELATMAGLLRRMVERQPLPEAAP
jgi:DNA-binding MarR family transcriptional regulator